MDNTNKLNVLLELLSSSSSSENEIEIVLSNRCNTIPKINNYIEDVVHNMTEKQVG